MIVEPRLKTEDSMKKITTLLLTALFSGVCMAQTPATKLQAAKPRVKAQAVQAAKVKAQQAQAAQTTKVKAQDAKMVQAQVACNDCPHHGQMACAKKPGSEGTMFVDFSAEYNGKVTKLSDYVGKGKYVLVDFWASWCGPCRRELPNLINVYNKYKGKKFEVLGVATWDEPVNTLRAIEQEKIPYPQMLNAQRAGSDAYGIQGIPEIILFGPDGKIIKRGLRGDAIEEAVKQYVK